MNGSNWLQFLSDQGQTFKTLYLFQTNEQKGILDDIGKDGDDNLRTAVAHQFAMERRLRKEIKVVQQGNKVLLDAVDELARGMKKLTQKVNVRQIMSYLYETFISYFQFVAVSRRRPDAGRSRDGG
jgi:hypothetical protein